MSDVDGPLSIDLTSNEPEPETDEGTYFEGYTDYRKISMGVARSIDQAVDAYNYLDSCHQEGAVIDVDLASQARGRIRAAAMKLIPEMRSDKDIKNKPYADILERWTEGDEEGDGFLKRLDQVRLTESSPGWLFDFVLDLRTTGWELGYLKAGKQRQNGSVSPERAINNALQDE